MSEQDYEQLTLFPVDFPASPSLSPGSRKALKMTVGSGRKCSELSGNSDPIGSLVRMCLVSSIWRSTRCFLTWTVKVTPRRRLLFRLLPSMPRTDETEFSFWPTPKASCPLGGCSGAMKTLKAMEKRGLITEEERRSFGAGNGGKTNPALLEWLMGYEQQFTKLIPTPTATDYRGGCLSRYWRPCSQIRNVERDQERIRRSPEKPCGSHPAWENWPVEPAIPRVVDGLSDRMDRIKCLGNAVVPQQVYPFLYFIAEIEKELRQKNKEEYFK